MHESEENDLKKLRRTINDVSLINVRVSNFLQRVFDIFTRRDRLNIVEMRWWFRQGSARECYRSALPGEIEVNAPKDADLMRVWKIHREEVDARGIAVYTDFPKGKTGLSEEFHKKAHRCLAALPIKSREGHSVGEMIIFFRHPRTFSRRYVEMLKALSSTLSLAFHRITLIEELSHQLVRVREAQRARNYFFASVSHDIRTPLNSIIGFTELLNFGSTDDATRRQYVDAISSSSQVLLQLVNDILDLAKLEAGNFQFDLSYTDFRSVVAEMALAFLPQAQSKGVKIDAKISEDFPLVEIDRQRIRQVLFNLVGNAVKFTDEGKVEISAEFIPDASGANVGDFSFFVRDTGRGIAEADMAKIARPFVQLMHEDASRGSGLGLAISRQFIERMGGTPSVKSQLGVGSVFKVAFKGIKFMSKCRKEQDALGVMLKNGNVGESIFAKKRVLLVDDIELNLLVLKNMFKKLGIRDMVLARSAVEAVAILESSAAPFDVVFTDMWMPEMSGWDLIKYVRESEKFANLPVYAVTADVEVSRNYKEHGFNGVIIKPVTFKSLSDRLATFL